MYANLRVTPAEDAEVRTDAVGAATLRRLHRGTDGERAMYAYEVIVRPDGSVSVKLDGQDGNGSYAEDAGRALVKGGVTITADF